MPSFSIYDTNYTDFFLQMSQAIEKNIHVPGYVGAVTADFSTSDPTQRIASQITLMKSLQKYFDYTMLCAGCGIRALEMTGTEADWARLRTKLATLRTLLAPIESVLQLGLVFECAEVVFTNLHQTYVDGPSMAKWWSEVLIQDTDIAYGPSGMRREKVVN